MITVYKSEKNQLTHSGQIADGVWISLIGPTEAEIQQVVQGVDVDVDFVRAALDEEERSRIELDNENGNLLIVVDVPCVDFERGNVTYETFPLGIIFTNLCIITVSLKETLVLNNFASNSVKTFFTFKKSRFILQILYHNATLYLHYLKQISKQSDAIENELHKSMKNKELIQLMTLEKSLVYFSTSLRANELVMEKLLRYDFIKKYPEDTDLLEDTIIENKQAIEMTKIYSDILSGTMDAFASIISNNLNIVMKLLAGITIVMAIPTMISSFYGMNVSYLPIADHPQAFWIILLMAIVFCFIAVLVMGRKNMF